MFQRKLLKSVLGLKLPSQVQLHATAPFLLRASLSRLGVSFSLALQRVISFSLINESFVVVVAVVLLSMTYFPRVSLLLLFLIVLVS